MNNKKLTIDDLTKKGVKLTATFSESENAININAQYDDESVQSLMAAWRLYNLIKAWHIVGIIKDFKRGIL